jgi:UDP-hydrolysing UDP-N-acetyl-D-glucosamine 2-epimerase
MNAATGSMRCRICVVTGSRADYGLLYWLLHMLREDPLFDLRLAVTGMHLSPEFGLTKTTIEQDGFAIAETVDALVASDTPAGISKSLGLGLIGFADAFQRMRPDLVVVLGDRYEIFAAATAAYIACIPIAHIGGGDITEGAFDEGIRHSITKMSHWHFVASDEARRRVMQLGEDPTRIQVVGHPGLEHIRRLTLLSRQEVESRLQFQLRKRNLLVTFHPVTLDAIASARQFDELLQALGSLGPEYGLIFTKPNADTEGRTLIRMLEQFVAAHENAAGFTSLGQRLYLSVATQVDAVVGNSSSGLFEIPALGKPTVNIGTRQQGRQLADSVIGCAAEAAAIGNAIAIALSTDCTGVTSPFGDGHTAERIVAALKSTVTEGVTRCKRFFDIDIPQ